MATNEELMSQIEYLKAAIHELLLRIPGPLAVPEGPAQADQYAPFPDGPRVLEVRPNVRMKLVAPVCPEYEPPFMAEIMGRDWDGDPSNGAPFVYDQTNAPPGMPARSASGYPLRYVGGEVYLLNANGQFKSDEEINAERESRRRYNERSVREWGNR